MEGGSQGDAEGDEQTTGAPIAILGNQEPSDRPGLLNELPRVVYRDPEVAVRGPLQPPHRTQKSKGPGCSSRAWVILSRGPALNSFGVAAAVFKVPLEIRAAWKGRAR